MVQNTENILRKLRAYYNRSFPIISVYLTPHTLQNSSKDKLTDIFEVLVNKSLTPEQITEMQVHLNYIHSFLTRYNSTIPYKSLAVFSGEKIWEILSLPDPVENTLKISHSPYLYPVQAVLHKYRRYLVVLADRQKARYFTLHLGQLESFGETIDPSVPRKVKGRGSPEMSKRVDRHIRDHLQKHLKYIGQKVSHFTGNKQITGVLIGGQKEIMQKLRKNLPLHLQKKVMGEFVTELNININEAYRESKYIIDSVSEKLNRQQVFTPI